MTDLQTAAQQALEALSEVDNCTYINDYGDAALDTAYESGMVYKAIAALRAALAQQDPEFLVTNCTLWGSPPKPHEYWSEFFSAMVETRTLAGVFISDAALAQQAEPVAWVLPDLLPVFSFKTAQLWKRPFAEDQIPLYTAPPQRKPLTEKELEKIMTSLKSPSGFKGWWWQDVARAIERAHGIGGDDGQA